MSLVNEDIKLLKKLSVAIVDNPRGTTKDLALAADISKATFHRLFGTRDNLESILMEKASVAVKLIIDITKDDFSDYREGVKRLIEVHYENKEFLTFVCGYQLGTEDEFWKEYFNSLDSFFLSGQKKNQFKIDFSVPAMTEIFVASFSGIVEAERKGRVGSNYLVDNLLNFLLNGLLK